jgi:hypothetical protein
LIDIQKIIDESNNRPHPDLDGLSPSQMHALLYNAFDTQSILKFGVLSDSDSRQVPMLNQVRYILELLMDHKELRLTKTGNLPVQVVSDIYNQGFINDELIERGISKLYQETSCQAIHLSRILCDLMGVTKKRNGKLSLTKMGEKTMANPNDLMQLLFQTFAFKFNWAYFDGYGQNSIGQLGIGYSLYLVNKYGNEMNTGDFYTEKYFRAFPQLINHLGPSGFTTPESMANNCYSLRTFSRFLDYFGVVQLENPNTYDDELTIRKTRLFDKMFIFRV